MKFLHSKIVLLLLVFVLSGCDLFKPPTNDMDEVPDETPVSSNQKLIAEKAIYSDGSGSNIHLANIELWMDGSPRRPLIVFEAVTNLAFFNINMTLPVCYVFPRPNGEISSWHSGPLEPGQIVRIESFWEQITNSCQGDYATVLWDVSTQREGSKDNITVIWDWPEEEDSDL